jgi:hypothetical protein
VLLYECEKDIILSEYDTNTFVGRPVDGDEAGDVVFTGTLHLGPPNESDRKSSSSVTADYFKSTAETFKELFDLNSTKLPATIPILPLQRPS